MSTLGPLQLRSGSTACRALAGALATLLLSCADSGVDQVTTKLGVKAGTPKDMAGHYLLDFGSVPLNVPGHLTLTLLDEGRASLTISAFAAMAPFTSDFKGPQTLTPAGSVDVHFTFAPSELGPASQTILITSTAGSVTVDLKGNGVVALPCTFSASPMQLDFGTVTVGTVAARSVALGNIGSIDCALSNVKLDPASDPAFNLPGGQLASATLTTTDPPLPVIVTFAPTDVRTSFTGTLAFDLGPPGTTVTVPITAASMAVPCTYILQGSEIDFGNVQVGSTGTGSVAVISTGPAECDVTGIAVASGSDPAFSLAPGQDTSAMVIGASQSVPISVQYVPTQMANEVTGSLVFQIGPPGTSVTVPLTAASVALPCAFHFDPTTISFGDVLPGMSSTMTVNVVSDSAVACSVSGVRLDATTNAAYSLPSTQATSGTISAMGDQFPIAVTFAPTAAGMSFVGAVDLVVGPPNVPAQVSIDGFAEPNVQPCNESQWAGGNRPDTRMYDLGRSSGTLVFVFDTFVVPDEMRVIYEGNVLFDTGCVGAAGQEAITYSGMSSEMTVTVTPNCSGTRDTAWQYTLGCPM